MRTKLVLYVFIFILFNLKFGNGKFPFAYLIVMMLKPLKNKQHSCDCHQTSTIINVWNHEMTSSKQ